MNKGQTPVMKQFWDAKEMHPDSIMLFRMGDFYETFEEDAILASNILGIALTKRSNGAASSVPLAGFPFHSLDQHLHKLLKAGHRVAICEQVEDPKQSKGIVKREVIEVLSPGTAVADKFINQKENNYLCAIYMDKTKCGIALLDYSTGEFYTCSRAHQYLVDLLNKFNVSEIIISENQKSFLNNLIPNNNIFTTTIPDWCTGYETAYQSLINIFNVKSLKGFGIESDKLAIISAGCALYYVESNYKSQSQHIKSISKINDDGIMGLDSFTIKNLEIFQSLSGKGSHGTLIGTIDYTVTGPGSRLLKNMLRHPLAEASKINNRLNMLDEFLNDINMLKKVQNLLKETSDLERIIAKISIGKSNPREILNIGITLSKIPLIIQKINKNCKTLVKQVSQFVNTLNISKKIISYLVDEPPVSIKNGGYILNGISEELDELRKLSKDASQWMLEMQENERVKNNIPSLKIGYNRVFGYYIEITKVHIDKVPENYIRKQTLTNSERYFTTELKEYEDKILSAEEKIYSIEMDLFNDLQKYILKNIISIQKNAKILAMLDVSVGLSILADKRNYCRPQINSNQLISIKSGRHPVVEDLLPIGEDFIPNDLYLDNKNTQIAIITGPNMAGKSTYLRQIGLITIMAQIGSYIPADSATIGIVDKLFTRVGASDNLAGGESTFLVEMNETANIINNTTSKSLILLDEIGRGTSTYDGLALAWAVTEYLHDNKHVQAKTLFATHYHEMISLAEELSRATNLNVAVKEYEDKIIFMKKIISGGANKSYGVHVAEMAGLPKAIINRANQILKNKDLKKIDYIPETNISNNKQIDLFSKKEQALFEELDNIDLNNITPLDALAILDELKKKYD